jgi:hypothetical protein
MKNMINKLTSILVRKRTSDVHSDLVPTKIRTVGEKYPFNETFEHIYKEVRR